MPLLSGCLTEEYDFYTIDKNGKINNEYDGGLLIAKVKGASTVIKIVKKIMSQLDRDLNKELAALKQLMKYKRTTILGISIHGKMVMLL